MKLVILSVNLSFTLSLFRSLPDTLFQRALLTVSNVHVSEQSNYSCDFIHAGVKGVALKRDFFQVSLRWSEKLVFEQILDI